MAMTYSKADINTGEIVTRDSTFRSSTMNGRAGSPTGSSLSEDG